MRLYCSPQAVHPEANKMYTSMRRWCYWESMVVDVYAFVADCSTCARNRVGKRRKTNYLKTFPPTRLWYKKRWCNYQCTETDRSQAIKRVLSPSRRGIMTFC